MRLLGHAELTTRRREALRREIVGQPEEVAVLLGDRLQEVEIGGALVKGLGRGRVVLAGILHVRVEAVAGDDRARGVGGATLPGVLEALPAELDTAIAAVHLVPGSRSAQGVLRLGVGDRPPDETEHAVVLQLDRDGEHLLDLELGGIGGHRLAIGDVFADAHAVARGLIQALFDPHLDQTVGDVRAERRVAGACGDDGAESHHSTVGISMKSASARASGSITSFNSAMRQKP